MSLLFAPLLMLQPSRDAMDRLALANPAPRVLVFSKTAEYRHDCIPYATEKLSEMAKDSGWTLNATEDATMFSGDLSSRYDAIVFLCTTGDILNPVQQAAMETFISRGGGFVGIHAAADTEYDWNWYGSLVGAYFKRHPAIQPARVDIHEKAHPASNFLAETWNRTDEWYDYRSTPPRDANVLMTLDESSYKGGEMGAFHPITWAREFGGGRMFYTGFGHTKESYDDPLVMRMLREAILWSAQHKRPSGARSISFGKLGDNWRTGVVPVLNGKQLKLDAGTSAVFATEKGGPNLTSKSLYGDALVHVEFMVPQEGNSGIFLQGRYEVQIRDTAHEPADKLDGTMCGGIYPQWISETNVNGHAPWAQAAGDPGRWQTLDIRFRAPRFDKQGKKLQNAVFEEVRLNGVRVQWRTQVVGPTRGGNPKEVAKGPLILQGDHSGMAFRNVWILEK